MLTKIYEQNPSERELQKVVDVLVHDGIVIYPTDSVYAFGCSLHSPKAIERLRRMKGKDAGVPDPETEPAGALHVRAHGILARARQGA